MKKVLSLVIVITVLFISFGVNSNISNASIADEETAIRNVVEQFFNTRYEILKDKNTDKFNILRKLYLKPDENIYLNYEIGSLEYLIKSYSNSGRGIDDYNNVFEYSDINISDTVGHVNLNLKTIINYNFLNEPYEDIVVHDIYLKKINNEWLITKDDYDDEFKQLYGLETDFDKLGSKIKSSKIEKNTMDELYMFEQQLIKENPIILAVPGDSYDYYNSSERKKAVKYARKYSEEGEKGTYYDSDCYNNKQFKHYGDNDCQNFVSQCIWAGFGGKSSKNKDYPMYFEWWADKKNTADTWNWTGTSNFYDEITENYDEYKKNRYKGYGLHGYSTKLKNIEIGDYVYVPGHVMFITKAEDTDDDGVIEFEEIEICAHTKNRKSHNLSALYKGDQPDDMKFIHIVGIKWNENMSLEDNN